MSLTLRSRVQGAGPVQRLPFRRDLQHGPEAARPRTGPQLEVLPLPSGLGRHLRATAAGRELPPRRGHAGKGLATDADRTAMSHKCTDIDVTVYARLFSSSDQAVGRARETAGQAVRRAPQRVRLPAPAPV